MVTVANSNIDLEATVKSIMTKNLITVKPYTIVNKVAEIFEKNNFHHIPVLDDTGVPKGVISKSDYHKLQHHFTLFNYKESIRKNEDLFETLRAEEIMAENPICIGSGTSLKQILKIFSRNEFHCLLVTENKKCVGIITPFDFLRLLY